MLYTHNQKLLPFVQSEEFLPPVSPWMSLAGLSIIVSVGTAISLSSWMKYNVTVKVAAAVRPTGEIRLVQPKVEGTVKTILVKENQLVKQGEAIASLDDEPLQIKKSQLQDNIQQDKLQIMQINAQISALNTQILAEAIVADRTIVSAKADLERSQREYQERQITTRSELLVAQANLQKAQADLQKAQADLSFAQVDRDRYEQLAQVGAIGRREFEQKKLIVTQTQATLEAEKKAVDIAQAKVQAASAAINPTNAMVAIATERIAQEIARGRATIATLKKEKQALIQRRVEIQNQLGQSQKELLQVARQMQDTILRASSDGIILKLNLRNPGQVLRASEAIAEIAPNNAPLVIKAMIPTQEIKNVTIGQKAQLRIDACPYPDYGTLKGVVKTVSPDAITSTNNNTDAAKSGSTTPAPSFFEATIQPESLTFGNGDRQCHIQSGMEVKADIISQEDTVLQFMLRKARLITDL
ncbi:HlyD family efflux transporter periplasmic adaptor subunit [Dendronalium sp. ChiSLP03b]|uniref:HlyD family efflux transporter periplasmic adaptor subunit n=1 Tax=Dendronalium sp. ChiSLP03b TaxID=3075381 RepID=UPI002AD39AEC|nr:HlyD family efflux transporter periplasmic adaptor subunit [Dendronalium sp. ChiSLP03b]MDZ8206259.1 HlyD family efflux transporter periplasmic adaptor subunit [Dendronalium sp. ChiSLP03b]